MAWNSLGKCLLLLGSDSEAMSAFRKAIRFKPDFGEAHGMLAAAYIKQQRFDEAEGELDYAVLFDRSADLLAARGNLYSELGRKEEAVQAWKDALGCAQKTGADYNGPELLYTVGDSLYLAGSYQDALAAMKLALTVEPSSAIMHHDAGSCYCKLMMYDSAIDEYKLCVQYDPLCVPGHLDLGLCEIDFHHDKAAALSECNILRRLDKRAADELLRYIYRH